MEKPDLDPKRRKMETATNPRDPSAGDPRWVILNCYNCYGSAGARRDVGDGAISDAETVAESCTSSGRHFRVSGDDGEPRETAELRVLRVGGSSSSGVWELKKAVPIVEEHGAGEVHVLRDWWEPVAVIPVGDRYLCWLNYVTGFLVCDMAADKASPHKLRYIRLPADLIDDEEEADEKYTSDDEDPPSMKLSRNMCAAGANAVRLVSVDPRCCCGGRIPGSSACKGSRFAFTVTTWTLNLTTTAADEPMMTWVQDGVLDCDELWALPEYGSLPRVPLRYPVVSSDDPDVVCFRIRNDDNNDDDCYSGDSKEWLLEVDIRRKRLRSVLLTTINHWKQFRDCIQAMFRY